MKLKFKNFKTYLILTICFIMILPINTSFAQDLENYKEFDEEFDLENISGGVKIINGNRYIMTKSEAQSEYLKEKNSKDIIEHDDNKIQPRSVVKTEIKKTRLYNGKNVRISPITHNKTSSNMKKCIKGEKAFKATGSVGTNFSSIASKINSTKSFNVSVSAKRSEETTVTIKPGERFFITFTPKMVEVKGRQLHLITHGVTKWENFTARFPRVLKNGIFKQVDGNIYYITKR